MKTTNILTELISYLELYIDQCALHSQEANSTDFLGFLNIHFKSEAIRRDQFNKTAQVSSFDFTDSNNAATDISILITLLFRYAKNYIKKVLKNSQIKSPDEFSILITLFTHPSMSKRDLILSQIMEKTSGTEIINRLVKMQLLKQFNDDKDKRSKRISITESGRHELMKILPQMSLVSEVVVGNLSTFEKNQLGYLLRKLEHYHHEIFLKERDDTLSDIAERHLPLTKQDKTKQDN